MSSRTLGAQSSRRWGLYQCLNRGPRMGRHRFYKRDSRTPARPCGGLIVAKRGTKYSRCPRCGRRVWLGERIPLYTHDDPKMVRRIIRGIRGWLGSGRAFIPQWKFGEWERRAEDKAAVDRFNSLLPWNLKA